MWGFGNRKKAAELVEEFARVVGERDPSLFANKGRRYRKLADRSIKLAEKIWSYGDEGREAMAVLLDHPDPNVASEAAAYLVGWDSRALDVLRECAKRDDFLGWVSRECLERWKENPTLLEF